MLELYQKGNVFVIRHRAREVHFFTGASQAEAVRLPGKPPLRYVHGYHLLLVKIGIFREGFRPVEATREGRHRFYGLLGDGAKFCEVPTGHPASREP